MRFLPVFLVGVMMFLSGCSRTGQFTAQAQAGQPIVRAVEEFQKRTGSYPASLAVLAPKHLLAVPAGWEYRMVTNGVTVTYTLRYYLGRGGVEYEPPVWYGNDEGHRTVLLRNE